MLFSALMLGLAGSLHCIGMCGPLMLALHGGGADQHWGKAAAYQLGRILTYTALGVFFGLAGKGMALAGLQQVLSIAAGIFMVGFAVLAWRIERILNSWALVQRWSAWLQKNMGVLLAQKYPNASFAFGMLNGLIPCGLVYAALAGAIASSGPVEGALFMSFFGLGTAPLMVATNVLGRHFGVSVRQKFQKIQPVLLLVSGILLIQRGLHLDLSLFESAVPPAEMDCH
jgi:sulfite exporter TauE/SafE